MNKISLRRYNWNQLCMNCVHFAEWNDTISVIESTPRKANNVDFHNVSYFVLTSGNKTTAETLVLQMKKLILIITAIKKQFPHAKMTRSVLETEVTSRRTETLGAFGRLIVDLQGKTRQPPHDNHRMTICTAWDRHSSVIGWEAFNLSSLTVTWRENEGHS